MPANGNLIQRLPLNVGVPSIPCSITARRRITQLIAESLRKSSLLVVRAPKAFGKTTAVAGWAGTDGPHGLVLWVDVKNSGENAQDLWREILAGVALIFDTPAGGSSGPADEVLRLLELRVPTVEVFMGLGEAIARDHPHAVLVLDNLQRPPSEQFMTTMIVLLRHYRGLRTIMITTPDPGFESTGAGMVLDARSIGAEELMFTADEVSAALLDEPPGLDPAEVHRHTGGQPGLVRAVIAAHRLDPLGTEVRGAVSNHIRAALRQCDLAIRHRDFLLRTSVAKRLTVDLAAALAGIPDSRKILKELEDRGHLRRRRRNGTNAFSYRRPLRRALREELNESQPDRIPDLIRTMVEHHLATGEPMKALDSALSIGDLPLANDITRDHQIELRSMHACKTRLLLARIPDPTLVNYPMLVLTLAMIRCCSDRDYCRTAELMELTLASADGPVRGLPLPDRAARLLAQTVALRFSNRWKEAIRAADAAEELFDTAPISDRSQFRRLAATVYIQAGATHLLAASHKRAEALLQRGLTIAAEDKAEALQQAGGLLALSLAATGRVLAAAVVLAQTPEPSVGDIVGTDCKSTPYRLAAALVAMEADDFPEAGAQLAKAGPGVWTGEFWSIAMLVSILIDLVTNPQRADLDAPERELARGDLPPPSEEARTALLATVSTAHLAAGNAGRAVAAVQGLDPHDPLVALVLGRAALATGDDARAESILSGAHTAGLDERRTVQLTMLRAVVHDRAGRSREAADAVRSAQRIMQRTGLGTTLLLVPETAMGLLSEAAVVRKPLQTIPASSALVQLTAREKVVLRALADTGAAAGAARALVVSVNTIKAQSRSIYRKLGVTTLPSAIAVAELQGLLPRA